MLGSLGSQRPLKKGEDRPHGASTAEPSEGRQGEVRPLALPAAGPDKETGSTQTRPHGAEIIYGDEDTLPCALLDPQAASSACAVSCTL